MSACNISRSVFSARMIIYFKFFVFFNVSCVHVCGTCLCEGTQVFAYVYQMPEEDRDNLR